MIGVQIKAGLDGGDLGLRDMFIPLEVALILRLEVPQLLLRVEVVEEMRVVVVPACANLACKVVSAPRRMNAMESTPPIAKAAIQYTVDQSSAWTKWP